jgi:hypothetical protein
LSTFLIADFFVSLIFYKNDTNKGPLIGFIYSFDPLNYKFKFRSQLNVATVDTFNAQSVARVAMFKTQNVATPEN